MRSNACRAAAKPTSGFKSKAFSESEGLTIAVTHHFVPEPPSDLFAHQIPHAKSRRRAGNATDCHFKPPARDFFAVFLVKLLIFIP